ncbi:hypothetical protein GC197_11845 [bacterium]|nr:hypothetical protein [bacterium]
MRTALLTLFLVVCLSQSIFAQEVRTYPGAPDLPDSLVEYLGFLQQQRMDSLKRFRGFLVERVEQKAVPKGALLNFDAIYTEAQLKAAVDPAVKREKLEELTALYKQREKLDAANPNATWFGVDRIKLGEMMRSEYESYMQKTAQSPNSPRR